MQFLNDWSNIIGTTIDDDMTLYMWNAVASEGYGVGVGSTLSKDEWHCLEMMAVISPTVGEARLWLDGNLEIEETGKNLGSNTIDKFAAGYYWANPYNESNTLYIDDAVVDTAAIGCLGVEAPCDDWWDNTYLKRKKITITCRHGANPHWLFGFCDHRPRQLWSAKAAPRLTGMTFGWFIGMGPPGRSWTALWIRSLPWNAVATRIWFKSQATIDASSSADNYYIYYDKSSASNPPDDWANVFMVGDDFNDGSLTSGVELPRQHGTASNQTRPEGNWRFIGSGYQ